MTTASIHLNASIQRRIDDFVAWFENNGGYLHPSLHITHDMHSGVHIRVKSDEHVALPNVGHKLIECPHTLSMSSLGALNIYRPLIRSLKTQSGQTCSKNEKTEIFKAICANVRPQCIAAVWLALQKLEASNSDWSEYLNLLPGAVNVEQSMSKTMDLVDTALCWTLQERQWIKGTNLEKGIKDLEEQWWAEWSLIEKSVKLDLLADSDGSPWLLYKWAMTIMGSRAFSSQWFAGLPKVTGDCDPDVLLYPGLDLLNHSPETQNEWQRNPQGFAIICGDDYRHGDQVWNTYGGKSNSELILSYGFFLENNKYDRCAIGIIERDHPLLQLVLDAQSTDNEGAESRFDVSAQFTSSDVFTIRPGIAPHPPDIGLVRDPTITIEGDSSTTGYPEFVAMHRHLSGFPTALLARLSCMLIIPREEQEIRSSPDQFSPRLLHTQLGVRNELAVTALLRGKLKLEQEKLDSINLADLETRLAFLDIHHKRHSLARAYVTTQLRLIRKNLFLLDSRLNSAFTHLPPATARRAASSDVDMQVKDATKPPRGDLMTLETAVSVIDEISNDVSIAFRKALLRQYKSSNIQDLRSSGWEEVIWSAWLCYLFRLLQTKGDLPPRPSMLLHSISKSYGPMFPGSDDHATAGFQNEAYTRTYATMENYENVKDLWSTLLTTSRFLPAMAAGETEHILRRCMLAVAHETLVVTVTVDGLPAQVVEEMERSECMRAGEARKKGQRHEGEQEEVRVVALYCGLEESGS